MDEIISSETIAEFVLSCGELCQVYARFMYDTSPLFITATWQDEAVRYSVTWWAVGESGDGENYSEYVTGFDE